MQNKWVQFEEHLKQLEEDLQHHSNEINNKWKPDYYCILYMICNTVM
jgi:hypothetical protein